MRMAFFRVSTAGGESAVDELNRFLSGHRVISVERQFVADGSESHWAVCVSYTAGETSVAAVPSSKKGRIDYKEVLDAEQFAKFVRLRELRKRLAHRDGVPAYALFTNEQLAAMVQSSVKTRSQLGEIRGIGAARVDKYGAVFLRCLQSGVDEASDDENSEDPESANGTS